MSFTVPRLRLHSPHRLDLALALVRLGLGVAHLLLVLLEDIPVCQPANPNPTQADSLDILKALGGRFCARRPDLGHGR